MVTESLTLAATGDAVIDRPLPTTDDERLKTVLRAADAAVTHVEPVLTDGPQPPASWRRVTDQYQYLGPFPGAVMRADPTVLDALTEAGLDLFTAASNHAVDFGRRGVESTIEAFRARNLPFAGIGEDLTAARAPSFLETSAGRVGLVNATTSVPPGGAAGVTTDEFPGGAGTNPLHVERTYRVPETQLDQLRSVAERTGIEATKGEWLRRENATWQGDDDYYFMHMRFAPAPRQQPAAIEQSVHEPDRAAILDEIATTAEASDWVVMSIHAHQAADGDRNTSRTPQFLRRFARACIDAGADAVVGTGPHTVRGIELYDGAPIFYSLGNFVFHPETISRVPNTRVDESDSSVPSVREDEADGEGSSTADHDAANWRSFVPVCEFDPADGFERATLYPCTLQPAEPKPRQGSPTVATGERADAVLQRVEELSAEFGTAVSIEDGIGVVESA